LGFFVTLIFTKISTWWTVFSTGLVIFITLIFTQISTCWTVSSTGLVFFVTLIFTKISTWLTNSSAGLAYLQTLKTARAVSSLAFIKLVIIVSVQTPVSTSFVVVAAPCALVKASVSTCEIILNRRLLDTFIVSTWCVSINTLAIALIQLVDALVPTVSVSSTVPSAGTEASVGATLFNTFRAASIALSVIVDTLAITVAV